jgi:hypothetical protein
MAAEEWERLKWRHGAKALRPSCQRSEWEPSALPKGQRNLRTSAPSLSDRFGASLTCPRPHHPLELGLESRASGGARRGLERPPLRHGRRAGERRKRRDAYAGAADNPSPAGRPCPRGRTPAKVKHRLQLHDARSGSFSPNGTNSSGLAPICVGFRVPPALPLPTAWFRRIVRDHPRAFLGGRQFPNGADIGASRLAPAN